MRFKRNGEDRKNKKDMEKSHTTHKRSIFFTRAPHLRKMCQQFHHLISIMILH